MRKTNFNLKSVIVIISLHYKKSNYYFLIRCAQSKVTLFIFCTIESGQETKDTRFLVSAVILSLVTSRVVMSNLQVFI